ncbi:MAG: FGGY family carbohydrate kinase [Cyclobacteriaceae bacterium]|jgi:sugar (pentulose or hexulose) kinase|nr:FGGY family carbohydrate kinase [Cyclobacteriaceae bacterium]
MATPVIAVFDIGKTNKKVFLFDEDYQLNHEQSVVLPETTDEDGFPCEDIHLLTRWLKDAFHQLRQKKEFDIRAVNFAAHGAGFVHLDASGKIIAPLYNYLKPYPEELKVKFYHTYGGEEDFSRLTASPVLGHLNSGMQLYWLSHQRPELFKRMAYALHLPEYCSYLFTGKPVSGITSIGCHTNLWDFSKHTYHPWVITEGVYDKLAPIVPSDHVSIIADNHHQLHCGIGLHDSSAALIPYLTVFQQPFVLIATGTWCITLNPFNSTPLTAEELTQDCLCYLAYTGTPIKASRQFAGQWHEQEVKRLAAYFHVAEDFFLKVNDDALIVNAANNQTYDSAKIHAFTSCEEAYTCFMKNLVKKQVDSTNLVLQNTAVKRIYVDGGFSRNELYMKLLAKSYPQHIVSAAHVPQASAIGAAMAIHSRWNKKSIPADIIRLKNYSDILT